MSKTPKQEFSNSHDPLHPFLRWVGGKRWLINLFNELKPESYKRYIEPFLGSGAIYFALAPHDAILNDVNEELINTFLGIQEDHTKVLKLLEIHAKNHSEDYYYKTRSSKPTSLASKAARMLYLNRTCFNGVYRVNSKGVFNVPIGDRATVTRPEDTFEKWHSLLKTAQISTGDFEPVIDQAKSRDLLFVDPPYSQTAYKDAFVKYNDKLFSFEDQVRLALALERAAQRGVFIVSTNGAHDSIQKLYKKEHFQLEGLSRKCSVSGVSAHRTTYEELLITANLK